MTWTIQTNKIDQEQLLVQESLYSLGNGFLGVRGNFEEGYFADAISIRGTYLNAFHDIIDIPYGEKLHGFPITQQKLLNMIDAQTVELYFGEEREKFSLFEGTILSYQRTLFMREGYSERKVHWRSPAGHEVTLRFRRMVSFIKRELFVQEIVIEPINFQGAVEIRYVINGDVANYTDEFDPRVASGHAKRLRVIDTSAHAVLVETLESGLRGACTADFSVSESCETVVNVTDTAIHVRAKVALRKSMKITKWNVFTDSLRHGPQLVEMGMNYLNEWKLLSFEELLEEQKRYLSQFWDKADVQIEGDQLLQQGIRYNLYQLLQAAGRDMYSNIAAKGLSGEGYEGHYFWDTEIYMLPLFTMVDPILARNLLWYRYSILDSARVRAKEMGHKKGALYPWRTISGSECSSFFPSGTAQYHISGDVAYSYIQYWQATGDLPFIKDFGCEVLIETARLWMDMGHFYQGQFRIDNVTGPDEYTCIVNNNYYTNVLAQHNLRWAANFCDLLREADEARFAELSKAIGLGQTEIEAFRAAATAMYLPYDEELGINPQDDSFLQKAVWDFANTPAEKYPLLLHYHPLTLYRYQVCKQADTVLAHFMLEDAEDAETIRRSFHYYEKITTHDSSLSSCIFSIMASKIGEVSKAYDYFTETARMDLDNTHRNTKDGLHMANMGGTWMAIVYGFAGLRVKDSGLFLRPALPRNWTGYSFKLNYHNRLIKVQISQDTVTFTIEKGESLTVNVYDEAIALDVGRDLILPLEK